MKTTPDAIFHLIAKPHVTLPEIMLRNDPEGDAEDARQSVEAKTIREARDAWQAIGKLTVFKLRDGERKPSKRAAVGDNDSPSRSRLAACLEPPRPMGAPGGLVWIVPITPCSVAHPVALRSRRPS